MYSNRKEKTPEEWRQYWDERWEAAKSNAEGAWEGILDAKAPQLRKALDAKGKKHVPCPNPAHSNSKDGFRMFKDFRHTGGGICNTCGKFPDGFSLLRWINGWSGKEALEEVEAYLGGRVARHAPREAPAPSAKEEEEQAKENENLRRSLNRAWLESIPIDARRAEPARRYLMRRGLSLDKMPDLMYHDSLIYHDGEKIIGRLPAIIGMIKDSEGRPITLHRTYITEDGRKAEVDSPKKMMSYPSDRKVLGGAIRLCAVDSVMGVAEGIETAIAAWQGSGIPTWATVNAVMMECFEPPPGIKQLIIFADKDRPSRMHPLGHGQEAAKKLAVRAWGKEIKAMVVLPYGEIPEGEKSLDWLDILKRDGLGGFPSFASINRKLLTAA